MISDTLLFWAVLAGLLCIDNFVLLPGGTDYLRINRNGSWRYEPGLRLQARHRDLIFLNPLNPFDRLAFTNSAIGQLNPPLLRIARLQVRTQIRCANLLSWIGWGYLLVLSGLACASLWLYFGDILLTLLVVHFVIWTAAVAVLFANRETLCLSRSRAFSLAFEACLVPGYLVNLGKRVWSGKTLNLPALTFGLHRLSKMPIDSRRELYALQLSRRLDDLAIDLNIDSDAPFQSETNDTHEPTAMALITDTEQEAKTATCSNEAQRDNLRNWLKEARKCLATSAQPAGS